MNAIKRKKGTVWFFGELGLSITNFMTVIFMLFVCALILFTAAVTVDVNVTGKLRYAEPKADLALLSFLDSSSGGYQMKDLLAYATLQGSDKVNVGGQAIDLKTASAALMNRITDRTYLLQINFGGPPITLSSAGNIWNVDHVSAETIVWGGENSANVTLVMAK